MPSADTPADALLVRAAATAQVLVEDLAHPELTADDHHHLTKVLRIRKGEAVITTDGQGSWRVCQWQDSLIPDGDVQTESPVRVTQIAFAITKGDKPEWTVQKLTEIGVTRITPFLCDRTIVKWDASKAEKHVERFQRIAYEAAMQCRRVWLPEVAPVATFDQMLAQDFAFAAPGGDTVPPNVDKIAIGPEGGWSESELRRARVRVSLGSTILRAETAALVAAARLHTEY